MPQRSESGSPGLAERAVAFGQAATRFAESAPEAPKTDTICEQLARAGAAVADSYLEACEAESELDFKHRMSICRKEVRETVRWLRMLIEVLPDTAPAAQPILQEAKELTLALSAAAQTGAKPVPDQQAEDEDVEP